MTVTDLKTWRDDLGLTQPQMARYVGVSVHTWRKWEQGQHGYPDAVESLIELLQLMEGNILACDLVITTRLRDARGEE
jgi:DNA-binding transcriptional regulator YiaG